MKPIKLPPEITKIKAILQKSSQFSENVLIHTGEIINNADDTVIDTSSVGDPTIRKFMIASILYDENLESRAKKTIAWITSICENFELRKDSLDHFISDLTKATPKHQNMKHFLRLILTFDAITRIYPDKEAFISDAVTTGLISVVKIAMTKKDIYYMRDLLPENAITAQAIVLLDGIMDPVIREYIADYVWESADSRHLKTISCMHRAYYCCEIAKESSNMTLMSVVDFQKALDAYTTSGKRDSKARLAAARGLSTFIRKNIDDQKPLMDRDVWFYRDFNLTPRRFTAGIHRYSVGFSEFSQENKFPVKLYVLYLIEESDVTTGTIKNIMTNLRKMFQFVPKPVLSWTQDDVMKAAENIAQSYDEPTSYEAITCVHRAVSNFKDFTDFLMIKGVITEDISSYTLSHIQHRPKYRLKKSAPTAYIVDQVFAKLPEFPSEKYVLIFLII